MNKNRHF